MIIIIITTLVIIQTIAILVLSWLVAKNVARKNEHVKNCYSLSLFLAIQDAGTTRDVVFFSALLSHLMLFIEFLDILYDGCWNIFISIIL